MAAGRQVRLLLWKDYLIRRRKVVTLGGILWATAVMLSLYIVRTNVNNQDFPTCQFPARALPSAGMLTFLQSFICSVNNECSPMDQYEEIPTYENSRLTQLQRQFTPLLYNETVLSLAGTVPDALKLLATLADVVDEPTFAYISKNGLKVRDLFTNPTRVKRYLSSHLNLTQDVAESVMEAELSFQGVFKGHINKCNANSLSQTLIMDNVEHLDVLVERLCLLSDKDVQKILMDILVDVNFSKYIQMLGDMYSKLSGDNRLFHLGDLLTAVLRITRLESFVPPELLAIFQGEEVEFSYLNITIVSKLMDLFKPTFGDTQAYKSLRDFTDSIVVGVQYLSKFFKQNRNAVKDATAVILTRIGDKVDMTIDMETVPKKLENVMGMIGEVIRSDNVDVYDVLSKMTNLIYKWLPKNYQHDILLYSTLLTKLMEGAHKVVLINTHIEEIAYDVSLRNPGGVEVLTGLPAAVVGKGFDALADAERTQILTSKLNFPGQMFCDVNRIQGFFWVSNEEAKILMKQFCTEAWKNYVTDLIRSFGIYEVKDNINEMASILMQETLGKDTSKELYTLEKDFNILKDFVKTINKINSDKKPTFDWNTLLKVNNDSDFMKVAREKWHLGKQVLITVHGALAKEVVKQNRILDYKITPVLLDITVLVTAVNEQLDLTSKELVTKVKQMYPEILETILTTAVDEDRTYKSLSMYSVDIMCNGVENASIFLSFPASVDKENLTSILCDASIAIEKGLEGDSVIGKAIRKIKNTTKNASDEVNWTKLISGVKKLHMTVENDYPYLYEFSSYGVSEDKRVDVKNMLRSAKNFWFSSRDMHRILQIGIKLGLRLLDLVDHGVFNITNNEWIKIKYSFSSVTGPLAICDEFIKLVTAYSVNGTYQADLPLTTATALRNILPNIPQLVVDMTKVITNNNADVDQITAIMSADPPWPCSTTSLSTILLLSNTSRKAVKELEVLFCMDNNFQHEWMEYLDKKNSTMFTSQNWNTTSYEPHMFLKFSATFDAFIRDSIDLKESLQDIFNDSSSVEGGHTTFISAWKYAIDSWNTSDRDTILRTSFAKIDAILNSKNSPIQDSVSLNILWERFIKCNGSFSGDCRQIGRTAWTYSLKFLSVMFENIAMDLITYFGEINEPNSHLLQIIGFTKNTGLYTLYDKLPEFVGVLLNSYSDYGFMTQIRRAANSQFWDCEAVLASLVPPPGSIITSDTIHRVKPFVCPSFLYWLSLPRGDNTLLDLVSKPQYFFYTLEVQNLTSSYENAFTKATDLADLLRDIVNKNETILKDDLPNDIEGKLNKIVNTVFTYEMDAEDPSYRLFNQINLKQYTATIYLTRIVTIVNKFATVFDNIKVREIVNDATEEELKKLEADLSTVQKIFKRRPTDALAFHFDVITDVLWANDNTSLVEEVESICDGKNNRNINILSESDRINKIICGKNYKLIYETVENIFKDDFENARQSLLNLVKVLQNNEENMADASDFFNKRRKLMDYLKYSIRYAYDLSIPIYLKYLQSNLQHYNIVLSFLSGQDWWGELTNLYNGPYSRKFFGTIESIFDITGGFLNNLDKIHLIRLLRDINVNSTDSFCLPNITLADYIPDSSGALSALKRDTCDISQIDLYKELPSLQFASQGYDIELKMSKEIFYRDIERDISAVESKLDLIRDGPKSPTRPQWISDEKMASLRSAALRLLSKETLTKISFGVLSNIVDGGTLFLNSSQCTLCSQFTTWLKQINLQLFKKQEYDNLLCHMHEMTLEDIHHMLKNDFHWDMALRELLLTRNYTKYELNKSLNEFLELVKLHVLDDLTAHSTKLAECLVGNITRNAIGNATLFATVLTKTIRLFRADLPHLHEIEGIKDIKFLKQLASEVTQNIDVEKPLKHYLSEKNEFSKKIMNALTNGDIVRDIENGRVNLRLMKNATASDILKFLKNTLQDMCTVNDCTKIADIIDENLNRTMIAKDLPKLQTKEFWRFNFVSKILGHSEALINHIARILGVASKIDIEGILEGRLAAMLDFLMQVLTDNTLSSVLYSIEGLVKELRPLLNDTALDFDLTALAKGLLVLQEYKNYLVEKEDLKLHVSSLFSNPDHVELELTRLGINNTNFWSVAVPRIHAGYIDLKPVLSSKQDTYHISNFVCQIENMSKVIFPSDVHVATTDDVYVVTPEDVYGAVIEQFCNLNEEQVKGIVTVLAKNLNFNFVMEKVTNALLSKLYSASNLTEIEGANVLERYSEMASFLPLVQDNVGNLTETLAEEPLFQSLKDFNSVGGLLSSPQFLSSAGNMLCGRSFQTNDNRFYKAIAETKDFINEPDPAQLDVLPTDFCRSLYKEVLNMGGGKIIWSFVKPLIMGKILYTPNNPTVEKIIQKANTTFAHMVRLTSLIHSFGAAFSSVDRLSQHREGVAVLRRLMTSPAFQEWSGVTGEGEFRGVDVEGLFDEFGDLKDVGTILSKASDLLHCVNLNRFIPMANEQELTHEAVKLTRVNEFTAGIVFLSVKEKENAPINVEYKIRMDIESVPTTTRIRNYFWTPGPEASFIENMRYFRGFLQIQDLVDTALIHLAHNSSGRVHKREVKDELKWAVYTQQTPYPCYRKDYFQSSLYESQAVIVAFFFSLLFTVSSAVRFIVSDKESGNTMLMSVMGVNVSNVTFSWFVASLMELIVTCLCVTAVLYAGTVMPRTDPTILFALQMLFGFSVLMFCYMLSKLFKSASFAAVCSALAYLITFMPYIIVLSLEAVLSRTVKIFPCLSMSTAFSYAVLHLTRFEAESNGAQWSDVWRSPTGDDDMSVGMAATMVIIDGLIYLAIGCIIDRFFGLKTIRSNITNCLSSGEKEGVSIVNISKIYGEGSRNSKLALDNVSIELHKGQITTLLGHNGAGKTTLTKILTGMLRPSKGHIIIRSEHERGTGISVCPQKDVLFEYMTAKEHIEFYAQLKSGLPLEEVRDEVHSMLSVLSLGALRDTPVCRLSGGTRRRVCVALAFVSRPRLVVLDEPTAGVDPAARRDIWSMIMKLKEDRTVLLTTHHLDEAELLSDQIVIMHKGQIHTIGSPIEIKRSLGNGYKLTVMFPANTEDREEPWAEDEEEKVSIEEKTKLMLAVVRDVIKNAHVVDVNGLEVEITLPLFDANGLNSDFLQLCSVLEHRQSELGFKSFALDCSSLEQVFFNVCSRADQPEAQTQGNEFTNADSEDTPSKSPSTASIKNDLSPLVDSEGALRASAWKQFLTLLHARYVHYTRNRWLLFLLIILPSLFVAIAMGFSMIRPPADNEVALRLHPDMYEHSTEFLVPQPSILSEYPDPSFARRVMDVIRHDKIHVRNWTSQDSPHCECSETRQVCDINENSTENLPEMMLLPNVTALNEWLVKSHDVYVEKRYGGFSSSLKNNITNVIAWYNNKGHHATPAFVNALNAAILKSVAGNNANIVTYSHPLKISHEQLSKSTVLQHAADAGISGMLLLAYSLVSAGGAIYLVSARTTQQKRLQLLCGVTPALYWLAALVWDLIIMFINIIITVGVLEAFGFPVFVARNNLPAICLLLFLFGYAGGCMVHLMEKLFSDPSLANMMLFCANVFVGLFGITILLILDIISETDETDYARWVLHKVFMLSPQFALGDALLEIAKNTVQAQVLNRFGMDTYKDPLWSDLIVYHCVALLLVGTVLMILNLAIEYDYFEGVLTRLHSHAITDGPEGEMEALDVAAERKRVEIAIANAADRPTVRLHTIGNINAGFIDTEDKKGSLKSVACSAGDVAACARLSKAFPALGGRRLALRSLTLGLPPGQCTALLGQNGAGKSTTFSMLTGQLRPSAGRIYLHEEHVTSTQLCQGLISYCPQSDALDGLLTVRETLRLYCRLRGIAGHDQVTGRAVEVFELSKYAEVRAGALSGGNKRKLCTAIAFTGRAPLVLLDEPTSGMDPVSRACVSRGVREATSRGRGVLLSTHALQDARVLAARVALLRDGKLVALAPLDDCLNRFGGGYVVSCRVSAGCARAVWRRVVAAAPHAAPRAMHHAAVQFLLPTHSTVDKKEITTRLSDIFRLMAELQGACDIEDYTINQSSLDQMFLSFTDKADYLETVDVESLPPPELLRRNSEEINSITAL